MTTQLELAPVLAELPSREELVGREEVAAVLQGALPLLYAMRDTRQVLDLGAPSDSGLPLGVMHVKPFYFWSSDPRQVGAWEITQGELPPVYVGSSLQQVVGGRAEAVIGTQINHQGAVTGELGLDRAKQVAGMLEIGATEFARVQAVHSQEKQKSDNTRRASRLSGIGRLLGFGR